MARVSLVGLTKRFGSTTAVRELHLESADGEFLCLLGPPGAGKTTTLRLVAGLELPDAGEIYFDNLCVNRVPPRERDVAMTQESYALYPHLTVFENLAFPLKAHQRHQQFRDEQVNERIKEIAELLEIQELLHRRPFQLSGGQKQRVALGRSLVRSPQVFLLDEPIAHLDAKLQHHLRAELKRKQKEWGTTTLWATPNYLEAVSMGDRIAVLKDGHAQQVGSPSALLEKPANEFVASVFGDPPINLLDCQLSEEDGRLWARADGLFFPVDARALQAITRRGVKKIRVGLRPNEVEVFMPDGGQRSGMAQVVIVEPLGKFSIITVEVGSTLLKLKAANLEHLRPGSPVALGVNPRAALYFDGETGLNICRED